MMQRASLHLATTMKAACGWPCVYSQTGEDDVALTMWAGKRRKTVPTDFGAEDWTDFALYCLSEDLNRTPGRGDTITATDSNDVEHTFTVDAPGEDDPWDYSDPYQVILRIRCRPGS